MACVNLYHESFSLFLGRQNAFDDIAKYLYKRHDNHRFGAKRVLQFATLIYAESRFFPSPLNISKLTLQLCLIIAPRARAHINKGTGEVSYLSDFLLKFSIELHSILFSQFKEFFESLIRIDLEAFNNVRR